MSKLKTTFGAPACLGGAAGRDGVGVGAGTECLGEGAGGAGAGGAGAGGAGAGTGGGTGIGPEMGASEIGAGNWACLGGMLGVLGAAVGTDRVEVEAGTEDGCTGTSVAIDGPV